MGVDIDATTNVEEVLVDQETTATGTIEFDIPGDVREYPLHTVFCIDVSGSMGEGMETDSLSGFLKDTLTGVSEEEAKITIAKAGLKAASQRLSADDTFGVVAFSNVVEAPIQPTSGANSHRVEQGIESLEAGGGTDIEEGLKASRRLLDSMPDREAIQWIVLISDGRGNVPSESDLQRQFAEAGITIQSAGIGDGYDRDRMLRVSQQTQGELKHIKSAKELQTFFQTQIQNARDVIALNSQLEIAPGDGVSINEVYYTFSEQQSTIDPDWSGETCIIDLGDINRETPPTVQFEMDILATEPALSKEVIDATVKTDNKTERDTITVTADKVRDISAVDGEVRDPVPAEEERAPKPDPDFVLQKISTLGQKGKVDEARSVLEDNSEVLSPSQYEEAERRLDEFESDDSGEGAYKLSTLSSDLEE